MKRRHARPNPIRHGWLALLLVAFAVRALVPAGWMPSATGFGLTFCNGDVAMPSYAEIARHRGDGVPLEIAIARAAIDRAAGKDGAPPAPTDPHPCAFAGMSPALAGPVLTEPRPPAPVAGTPARAAKTVAIGRGLAAPPPPATGPPTLA